MMRPVPRQVNRHVRAGNRVSKQMLRPSPDVRFHVVRRKRAVSAKLSQMIDASRDRIVAVGEGAIEIEKDGVEIRKGEH